MKKFAIVQCISFHFREIALRAANQGTCGNATTLLCLVLSELTNQKLNKNQSSLALVCVLLCVIMVRLPYLTLFWVLIGLMTLSPTFQQYC